MKRLVLPLAAVTLFAGAATAQPAIPNFGRLDPPQNVQERPQASRTYKVVFEVTKGAPAADQLSPNLDRVARFANLLAAGGVPPQQRKLVAVLHGPATEAVLTDAAYGRRHNGAKNPNVPLIAALKLAGVEVHVCSHALAMQKFPSTDVMPGVQVDLAAMLTIAHLQLDGYALIAG